MSRVERLAAVVVNYDSGALATSCVASLVEDWTRSGRPRRNLSVVVVDNASPAPQERWFAQLATLGAGILRSPENGGYARAVNLGAEQLGFSAPGRGVGPLRGDATGPDALMILNPDLLFLPGSVGALLEGLARHPDAGVVGPRTSFDPEGCLQLPPNEVPTPRTHWRDTLAQLDPVWGRAAAAHRARHAARVWTAQGDLLQETLSGACLVVPRRTLVALGDEPVLDPVFPLYFEDTDLCRRLARRGLRSMRIGDAQVCHLWARSSGAGAEFKPEARARFTASRATWFRRTHGALGLRLAEAADRVLERWPSALRHRPIHAFEDLGAAAEPVELRLARPASFVLEVGLEPTLSLAGGALGEGSSWRFPASVWDWLFEGPVFCRALARADGALLGAWTLHKTSRARTAFPAPALDAEVA